MEFGAAVTKYYYMYNLLDSGGTVSQIDLEAFNNMSQVTGLIGIHVLSLKSILLMALDSDGERVTSVVSIDTTPED